VSPHINTVLFFRTVAFNCFEWLHPKFDFSIWFCLHKVV
jgi:hypothetical protein